MVACNRDSSVAIADWGTEIEGDALLSAAACIPLPASG